MSDYREEAKAHDKTIELLQKLQAENEKFRKVVEAAAKEYRRITGHKENCYIFGRLSDKCDCGCKKLVQALEELEGE